jgi:hypothetical protein
VAGGDNITKPAQGRYVARPNVARPYVARQNYAFLNVARQVVASWLG